MAGACRELLIRQGKLRDSVSYNKNAYSFSLTLLSDTAENGQTTSQQEAEELITALIAKGISNIDIILKGEKNSYIASLSDFAKAENLNLSAQAKLFTKTKRGTLTLSGDTSAVDISRISETAEDIIATMRSTSTGVSLSDCGYILPTDYSNKKYERSGVLSSVSDICTLLSSHGSLTVSQGNIYTLKYAHSLMNIPERSPLESNDYCKGVPF